MSRYGGVVLAVFALLATSPATATSTPLPSFGGGRDPVTIDKVNPYAARRGRWVPGEVVVRFPRALAPRQASRRLLALGIDGARVADSMSSPRLDLVRLPKGVTVDRAVRRISALPGGFLAEANKLIFPDSIDPSDARFDDLWGLDNTGQSHAVADPPPTAAAGDADADIDATEAWDSGLGTASTVVAVVDSGVDVVHPDLESSLWNNPGEVPSNGEDDDDNGYVDDVHGWNFPGDNHVLVERRTAIAGYDHGTHVAGTIAAEINSLPGEGDVVGVCPGCRLMVLKFMKPFDTDGDGRADTMVGTLKAQLEALAYARREGADIVNSSFGSPQYSRLERRAYRSLQRAGVISVAAAGNASLDNDLLLSTAPAYPASYSVPGIVSVAATNHRDHYAYDTGCAMRIARYRCAFTNWGRTSVDLAAPGVDVLSTTPTSGPDYKTFNGTSMASPHAAGAAGLVISAHPRWGVADVKNALMNSADRRADGRLRKLWAFPGGPRRGTFTRTNGRLNAARALRRAFRTPPATVSTDGNISGARFLRQRVRGKVRWPGDVNDVYKKRLVRGRRYRVALRGPTNKDFDVWVWRPGTKEIWQLETGCFRNRGRCQLLRFASKPGTADERTVFRAKRSALHYFHVSAWILNRGRYLLTVRRA